MGGFVLTLVFFHVEGREFGPTAGRGGSVPEAPLEAPRRQRWSKFSSVSAANGWPALVDGICTQLMQHFVGIVSGRITIKIPWSITAWLEEVLDISNFLVLAAIQAEGAGWAAARGLCSPAPSRRSTCT